MTDPILRRLDDLTAEVLALRMTLMAEAVRAAVRDEHTRRILETLERIEGRLGE